MPAPTIERISIEPSTRCGKGCAFCYNGSNPAGSGDWSADEVVAFALDCARHGTLSVSFGGGEPLEWEPLFDVLERLDGRIFRSLTTNGLHLDRLLDRLVQARPDKVHLSLHFPEREPELDRVIRQVKTLEERGLRSGLNLLVDRQKLDAAREATRRIHEAGIGNERIVFLPRRGQGTPTPRELGEVAGGMRFQSMTCLVRCGPSPRFASISADKRVGWCSYTTSRRRLPSLDHAGLSAALDGLGLSFCGGRA